MPRTSTGKRLRFDVFNRDHFTCQYCGAQPPGVVLVVDHIVPVAEGGATVYENLTTACEPCNQGKAHRQLGSAPVRPDADLMYLAAMQEAAELKRFLEASQERDEIRALVIARLKDAWDPNGWDAWSIPDNTTLIVWLEHYPPELIERAFHITREAKRRGSVGGGKDALSRYCSGVLCNLAEEN